MVKADTVVLKLRGTHKIFIIIYIRMGVRNQQNISLSMYLDVLHLFLQLPGFLGLNACA